MCLEYLISGLAFRTFPIYIYLYSIFFPARPSQCQVPCSPAKLWNCWASAAFAALSDICVTDMCAACIREITRAESSLAYLCSRSLQYQVRSWKFRRGSSDLFMSQPPMLCSTLAGNLLWHVYNNNSLTHAELRSPSWPTDSYKIELVNSFIRRGAHFACFCRNSDTDTDTRAQSPVGFGFGDATERRSKLKTVDGTDNTQASGLVGSGLGDPIRGFKRPRQPRQQSSPSDTHKIWQRQQRLCPSCCCL